MKLQDAVEPFLMFGRAERMYATETQDKFRECLRTWILPFWGDRELDAVTRLDVLGLRDRMHTRGLSVARQYNVLMVAKLLFRFCREVLKADCIDPAEIRLPRRPHRPVEFLTENEIARLFNVIPTYTVTGLRCRALIEVLLSTGMRISEALSLDCDSIDRSTLEAEIVGKGNKQRTVFFSKRSLGWIDAYLRTRLDDRPALFVTTGKRPKRLGRDDMSKLFRRLRRQAGIKKRLTPHMLRHTFCTQLLHNGADITFIKELAGHQDIETTARYYLGVDKKSLKQVLNRCRPSFLNESPSNTIAGPAHQSTAHRPDTVDALPLRRDDPAPGNTGMSSPGVRAPGSP